MISREQLTKSKNVLEVWIDLMKTLKNVNEAWIEYWIELKNVILLKKVFT